MIILYSGTPGSGKSLHLAKDIYKRLNAKKYNNVIANFNVNLSIIKSKNYKFIYKPNEELTPDFFIQYARENHVHGVENQTLVCIDESQLIWNAREWQKNLNRGKWIEFFSVHRHFGFDFILVSLYDRMLDKQIRCLVEYEVKHRKVSNSKLSTIIPFELPYFTAVKTWYGDNERISGEFFSYSKKFGSFYDSYHLKFI